MYTSRHFKTKKYYMILDKKEESKEERMEKEYARIK